MCTEGYLLYDVDNTCYEEIIWPFPYLICAFLAIIISWIADCYHRATNILHASVWFLSFIEVAAMLHLLSMQISGAAPGDRSLFASSVGLHFLLNFIFAMVHLKSIMEGASLEYRQVKKDFRWTFWICNGMAYGVNFKIALILISQVAGWPRYSGTFNSDSW